ncbi:hypothetical protein L1987_46434 [Smallanthus sonchifolius]|uniref:Uncharacterized protein n=1 Tax=Smallanthus sonchifolius TaxID=185202 RepID=A0ACB9FZR9_9ASTR|nr:hypothetical protein L1987_46434 [Smallanthus sonchifolius]
MGFIGRPMMESMKLTAHERETGGDAIEGAGDDVGTADTGGAGKATQPPPPSDLAFRVDRIDQMHQTLLFAMQWIMHVEIQRAAAGGYDLPPLPFPVPPPFQ